MKKVILIALSVLCLMMVLSGCGSSNKPVGVWTELDGEGILYFAEDNTGMSKNVSYTSETFEYDADGETLIFLTKPSLETKYTVNENILTITVEGTDYKYKMVELSESEIDEYLAENGIDVSEVFQESETDTDGSNSSDITSDITFEDFTSEVEETTSEIEETTSEIDDTTSEIDETTSETDNTTSEEESTSEEDSAPEEDSTSEENDATSEIDESMPEIDETTSEADDTPSQDEDTSEKDDAPATELTDDEITESILGAWSGGDNNMRLTYIFFEDGTGIAAFFPFTYTVQNGVITVTIEAFGEVETGSGRYEIDGDRMYIEGKDGLYELQRTEMPEELPKLPK